MSKAPREPSAVTGRMIQKRTKKQSKYDRTQYTITLSNGTSFTGSCCAILKKLKLRTNNTTVPYRLRNGITDEKGLRAKQAGLPKGTW